MSARLKTLEENLFEELSGLTPLLVLVSGGVDSALLAEAARRALPAGSFALLHAELPFSPSGESEYIKRFAAERGTRLLVERIPLLDVAEIAENGPERCYHCKKWILKTALSGAFSAEFESVADGTVLDDFGDYRPGLRATEEFGVRHPLADSGFGKREVRLLARRYGLSGWNRPASACLASRIPTGSRITREKLERIAAAEEYLAGLGFRGCRARHIDDATVSVEVAEIHLKRLRRMEKKISGHLSALGFSEVRINPDGYKKGAMNAGTS